MLRFPASAMHLVRCLETARPTPTSLTAPWSVSPDAFLRLVRPRYRLRTCPHAAVIPHAAGRFCDCIAVVRHTVVSLLLVVRCGPVAPSPALSDENGPTCCRAANCFVANASCPCQLFSSRASLVVLKRVLVSYPFLRVPVFYPALAALSSLVSLPGERRFSRRLRLPHPLEMRGLEPLTSCLQSRRSPS